MQALHKSFTRPQLACERHHAAHQQEKRMSHGKPLVIGSAHFLLAGDC
jgi:hypothetical protein